MTDLAVGTLIFIAGAAFLAGWIDAVVGGGGLVQLPALMIAFPQAAPVQLLAANKVGSIAGTSTSSVTYLRRVPVDRPTVAWLVGTAFIGSVLGALGATRIPREAFNPVILVVLVVVGAYTVVKPKVGRSTALKFIGRQHLAVAAAIGFVVGMYDGALGPGTGSFFTIALVAWLGYGFLEATAKAKVANFATNLAALAVFVPQGSVVWKVALVVAAANMTGAYVGARTAVARGSAFVRIVFITVVSAFIAVIGWEVFGLG